MRWTWIAVAVAVALAFPAIPGCGKKAETPKVVPPMPLPKRGQAAEEKPLAGATVLMVVAPKDFRDEEYAKPRKALEDAGAKVVVASITKGKCTGVAGTEAEATVTVAEAKPEDYTAIVFVGGPGMARLLDNEQMIALAKKFHEAKKPMAAICVAPVILANAGVLKGIEATAWPDVKPLLEKAGATVSDKHVVVQGIIVTADGPQAANAFARAVVGVIASYMREKAEKGGGE